MAKLALSVGLGVAFSFIPGIGTSFGFALGSLIGGLIGQAAFPGKGTHVYGPRLNDMQVSSSAPGVVIPILYGSMRLGGNIIWSSGIQEVATTKKQSSKGIGPSVSQTTYTYFASFASAFCQGPAQVTRVWGDAKLIYDSTGKGQVAKNLHNVPAFYPGDETQLADPLMVSHDGANNVPAYRGTCYAVWEKLPLANFGNRIPNIRAEVSSTVSTNFLIERIAWSFANGNNNPPLYMVSDQENMTVWQMGTEVTFGSGGIQYINRIDIASNTVTASGVIDMTTLSGWGSGDQSFGTGGGITVDGQGYLWAPAIVGGHVCVVKLDPWSFKALLAIRLDVDVCLTPLSLATHIAPDGTSTLVGFGKNSVASGGSGFGFVMYTIDPVKNAITGQYNNFVTTIGTPTTVAPGQIYPVVDFDGNAYFIFFGNRSPGSKGDWYILKINLTAGTSNFATPGPVYADAIQFAYTPNAAIGTGKAMFWNSGDNTLIVLTSGGAYLKIDPSNGTILETVGSASSPQFYVVPAAEVYDQIVRGTWMVYEYQGTTTNSTVPFAFRGRTQNGIFWAPSLDSDNGHANVQVVSGNNLNLVSEYDLGNFPNKPGAGGSSWTDQQFMYDPLRNSMLASSTAIAAGYPSTFPTKFALYHLYLNRNAVGGNTLDAIVLDLCEKAGISSSDVDVTQLASTTVLGYPITHLAPGKELIGTLGQAFFFEARESDFKLQFIPRGQSPILTIPESDLGLEQDKAKLSELIGQQQDIPKDVEIIYIEPTQDYQQSKQHHIRHHRTIRTLNKTSIMFPIVMTSDQAATLTDKILWTAEAERRSTKTNLWKAYYLLLDPCDVILYNYNGTQLSGRITGNTIGQNFATAVDITSEDTNNYISNVVGNDSTGFIGQTIAGLAKTLLWILDIPYLKDTDADAAGNIDFYFAMAPASGGSWAAGVLYNSSDNASFNQEDASANPIAYGIAQNALGSRYSLESWDNTNTLTVRLANGLPPSSDTELNVLNGANAAILYPSLEVIQFQNVVNNGDGTYTLSKLLRGRRGTEWAAASHAVGEVVLFPLIQAGLVHEQVSLGLLNLLRYYRGITVGADLNSNTNSQAIKLKGRGLQPYSPASFKNAPSGSDILFTWIRRTRLGGGLHDGTGHVPLAEDNESYDLTIVDGSGNVVRTFSNIQPPGSVPDSWTSPAQPHQLYTAAQQSTDGYTTAAGWTAVVYQLSAQVGRGFSSTTVLP